MITTYWVGNCLFFLHIRKGREMSAWGVPVMLLEWEKEL